MTEPESGDSLRAITSDLRREIGIADFRHMDQLDPPDTAPPGYMLHIFVDQKKITSVFLQETVTHLPSR